MGYSCHLLSHFGIINHYWIWHRTDCLPAELGWGTGHNVLPSRWYEMVRSDTHRTHSHRQAAWGWRACLRFRATGQEKAQRDVSWASQPANHIYFALMISRSTYLYGPNPAQFNPYLEIVVNIFCLFFADLYFTNTILELRFSKSIRKQSVCVK